VTPSADAVRRGIAVAGLVLAAAACTKKAESHGGAPVPVTGLAAVPASARVVVSFDVERLGDAPLVARATEQLLARAPELGERIDRLARDCNIDVATQVKRAILALGDPEQSQVLLVVTGKLDEATLAQCLTRVVGSGGGAMTAQAAGGRTVYQVAEGNRTVYFAFGQGDTVAIGTSQPWLVEALGTGPKVADDPEMKALTARANSAAPVWAAGKVDPRVGQGLVKATGGQVAAGPKAVFGSIDPAAGLRAELGVVMASDGDAKALETLSKGQLGLMAMAAQIKGLGPVVGKITTARQAEVVRFGVVLSHDEVNEILKAIDMRAPPSQDAPPAGQSPDSGTGPLKDAGSSGD